QKSVPRIRRKPEPELFLDVFGNAAFVQISPSRHGFWVVGRERFFPKFESRRIEFDDLLRERAFFFALLAALLIVLIVNWFGKRNAGDLRDAFDGVGKRHSGVFHQEREHVAAFSTAETFVKTFRLIDR